MGMQPISGRTLGRNRKTKGNSRTGGGNPKKSNNDMDVFHSRRREIREINTRNVTVIHKCRKGLEKMPAVVWGPSRIPS